MSNVARDQITRRGFPHCGPRSNISIVHVVEEVLQRRLTYLCVLSTTHSVVWLKVIIAISATLPGSPSTQHHGKEGDEGSSWSPQEGNEGDEGKEGMKVSWVLDCFNSWPLVFSHALAFWWPVHWKQVTWSARIELLKVKCACVSIIQPPSNEARDPVPLIPLELDLMGKLSNHIDPLPSS